MSDINHVVSAADADARKVRLLQEAAKRVRKYSVYKIMEALRSINAYTQVKAMLEQHDLWDRIVLIGTLPSDNEYFVQHYPTVRAAIQQLAPDADIDALLAECEEK